MTESSALRVRRRLLIVARDHPVWLAVLGAVLVGAPGIVAVVSQIGAGWYPTGDVAHTELMLRSIPRHFPLIGVAARVGEDLNNQGSTPGAAMAYVLYPVYLLFGRSSFGMIVSVLVAHLSAIGASLFVAYRLGGLRAMWALGVVTALVVRSLAPRFFLEPWNVWVPLFAFLLFVVLLWGVALGRHDYLPLAAVVGIYCVQTHISYVPLVVGLLSLAVLLIVGRRWIGSGKVSLKPVLLSAALVAVMWIPPIIEQFRSGPGNLGRLWRHFSSPREDTVGLSAAFKAMAGELNLAGPFLTGPGRAPYDDPNIAGFLAFVVIVGVGIASAYKKRQRPVQYLQGVLGVSTVIGLVATARVFGHFYDYVIRWMWMLAVLWLAVSLWAIVDGLRVIRHRSIELASAVAVIAIVAGVSVSVGAQAPYGNDSRLVGGLAPLLAESVDPSLDHLLRWHDPAALGGTGFGLLLEMEKRGVSLYVDAWAGAAARPYRVRAVQDTDVVLCLVVGPENIQVFRQRSQGSEVAWFDPRTPAEQIESNALRQDIESLLRAAGREDQIERLDSQYGHTQILLDQDTSPELFTLMDRYSEIRLPGALFVMPQGSLCIP